MKLKTYVILASAAFVIVAGWLLLVSIVPITDGAVDWRSVFALTGVAFSAFAGLAILYAIVRLFLAVVHRLERR